MSSLRRLALSFAAAAVFWPGTASANERHFTYTYESATLARGVHELEPWSTFRAGRQSFYSRFDERLEFETGLTDRLQTSLYLNFSGISRDLDGRRVNGFAFQGISSEWKFRLSDAVADAIGSALYFEFLARPDGVEFEARVILDRRIGNFLVAFNAVGEYELEFGSEGTNTEILAEADLSAGYAITEHVFTGLELREQTVFTGASGLETSTLFGGPVLSLATGGLWATLTVMPQLAAFYGGTAGTWRDLTHHEQMETRLILGMHF